MAKKEKGSEGTKAVAVQQPKKRLAWGGVLPTTTTDKGDEAKKFCNLVAEVYGVPSLGVNVLGNQPYINKNGRLYLLGKHCTGKTAVKSMKTEYLEMAKTSGGYSVAKATIELKDGTVFEAIGEASKESVKLEAVQKTTNMMAETRAINRVVWLAVAHSVWDTVAKNLQAKNVDSATAEVITRAGEVSAEEMERPPVEVIKTDDAKLIALLQTKIDACQDEQELFDYATKLRENKKVTENVKTTVLEYLRVKVAKFGAIIE